MLFIFLAFIIIGLGLFGVLFYKELKSSAFVENADHILKPVSDGGIRLSGLKNKGVLLKDPEVALSTPDLSGAGLSEKCAKLEQLLAEKNVLLNRLELELTTEHSHRGEFESLRDILQSQLEDLKTQNKRVREELANALRDNIDLQAKLASGGNNIAPSLIPKPKASVPLEVAPNNNNQIIKDLNPSAASLSLHDIFELSKKKPMEG